MNWVKESGKELPEDELGEVVVKLSFGFGKELKPGIVESISAMDTVSTPFIFR